MHMSRFSLSHFSHLSGVVDQFATNALEQGGLENPGLLLEPADVLHDLLDVIGLHGIDPWHVSELPVMRLDTIGRGPLEGGVAVMIRLIDLVHERRPLCGSDASGPMAD